MRPTFPRLVNWIARLMALSAVVLIGCGDPRPSAANKTKYDPNKVDDGGGGGGFVEEATGSEPYNPALATATIKGLVLFDGKDPVREAIGEVSGTPQCAAHGHAILEEDIVVKDGKLANVIVYVQKGAGKWAFTPPSTKVEFDQVGCQYIPHVAAAMVDQTVRFKNSDSFQHNIHYTPKKNSEQNFGQSTAGKTDDKTFSEPELPILIKCDIHKWMVSYLGVFRHPFFAVTKEDGAFEIKLPPGEYTIATWQEVKGKRILGGDPVTVTVGANETKQVDFKFKPK